MPKQPSSANAQPDLLDSPRPGSNLPEFTVGDLSRQLKRTVEEQFGLVRVKGEIGECKLHSSGHMYLSLKDDSAVLAAVCWKGQVSKLGLRPETGMEVVCTGRLTTFMGQSKYQMVVESMALAGVGALLKLLEERRQKLAAEGLFDATRKQLLPFLPEVIGVVTSPTGAVIRDILHRLADRFPRTVFVWPVAVQGEGAAAQIAAAIDGFNKLEVDGVPVPRPDLLIVARGGGSLEDLMPFNEEIVVRAVANSLIPVISAVGHETDTTLIDYAADVRAPTPTAAAEMAVPVRENLLMQVADHGVRLQAAALRLLRERKEHIGLLGRALGDPARALEPLAQRLDERAERLVLAWRRYGERQVALVAELAGKLRHPQDVLRLKMQQLDERSIRLPLAWQNYTSLRRSQVTEFAAKLRHPQDLLRLKKQQTDESGMRLALAAQSFVERRAAPIYRLGAMLDVLSPRAVLGRGYSLVYDAAGQLVTLANGMKRGDKIAIELQDGVKQAVVE